MASTQPNVVLCSFLPEPYNEEILCDARTLGQSNPRLIVATRYSFRIYTIFLDLSGYLHGLVPAPHLKSHTETKSRFPL